jgi:hypothetical protein
MAEKGGLVGRQRGLIASLDSAGVETTAEAFETRMKMMRSTGAAPLTAQALRVAVI